MERIGPYEVVRELGRGGMGVVYEVRDTRLDDRRLALKLLHGGPLLQPEELRRFEREGQLLARVRHPQVVRVHELGVGPRGTYLVTELVEGEGLDQRLARGPLGVSEAATLVRDLARGLAAVHAQGVLHRDLKPQNVRLRPDGSPVLLDFGLARGLDLTSLTQTGVLLGTPKYMAPEQVEDPRRVDERADVYGLGGILFACLCGRAPFEGATPWETISKVLSADPRWPSRELPVPLLGVLRRALAKDPAARHASAAELADALDEVLAARAPAPRRAGRALALSALVAGLLLGAMALALRGPAVDPAGSPAPGDSASATPSASTAPSAGTTPSPAADPAQAALGELARWDAADRALQERAAALAGERLGAGFEPLGLRDFACGPLHHRLALFRHRATGIELVLLPGATFLMGSAMDQRRQVAEVDRGAVDDPLAVAGLLLGQEHPRHEVRLAPFLIAREPRTSSPADPNGWTWSEAHDWLRASGLRLPSEAEFEYAASGGSDALFFWGDVPDREGRYTRGSTDLRAQPLPNAFGLTRVVGWGWQWCEDDFLPGYLSASRQGAPLVAWPRFPLRACRGGTTAVQSRRTSRAGILAVERMSLRAAASLPGFAGAPAPPAPPSPTPIPSRLPRGVELRDDEPCARDGSILVWVPPGSFAMGHEAYPDSSPRRPCRVDRGFYLGKLEVTFAQFGRFCAETGGPPPNRVVGGAVAGDLDPVVNVSWYAAREYCAWAGGRLPTTEEWEYAAAGPEGLELPWGQEWDWARRANLGAGKAGDPRDGFLGLAPVGSFPLGASPFGCLDLCGNASEWTSREGPREPSRRVVRGGSWRQGPDYAPVARYLVMDAASSSPEVGFRLCVDAP
ncbi:MAG: bifunctional serine/threonine-protein kinase/formylglycine-generating enzyme family protein [Planctomycetota bacterium]